ncbi:MAG: hypothetical protein H8Z69_00735 [Nanohaloarchaea archaeon]|nr:hypothetical protein [Candidatus Nanohaloarchaea archaeon]
MPKENRRESFEEWLEEGDEGADEFVVVDAYDSEDERKRFEYHVESHSEEQTVIPGSVRAVRTDNIDEMVEDMVEADIPPSNLTVWKADAIDVNEVADIREVRYQETVPGTTEAVDQFMKFATGSFGLEETEDGVYSGSGLSMELEYDLEQVNSEETELDLLMRSYSDENIEKMQEMVNRYVRSNS